MLLLAAPSAHGQVCLGDCDGDGRIGIEDLHEVIGRALDGAARDGCVGSGSSVDEPVTIDDVVAVAARSQVGCPPTPTPTPEPTATATINRPPVLSTRNVYRSFASFPIAIPMTAVDPDGGPLVFSTTAALPDTASLDPSTGLFSWMPADEHVGSYVIPVTVMDSADPPLGSTADLALRVLPLDACVKPVCTPAGGCQFDLEGVGTNCCADGPPNVRVPEPDVACPAGRSVHIGRNSLNGFGRLYNCDRLRAFNSGQVGVTMRFHVEIRCFDVTTGPIQIDARMETKSRLLFSRTQFANFTERRDGWAERLFLALPVQGPSPFFDLGEAEANFEITVIDRAGNSASDRVRVILQFEPLDDLPDVP